MRLMRNYICASLFALCALPKICFGLSSSDSEILISQLHIIDDNVEQSGEKSREVGSAEYPEQFQLQQSERNSQIPPVSDVAGVSEASEKDVGDAMVSPAENEETASHPGTDDVMVQGDDKVSLLPEDAESLEEDGGLFGLKTGYFHPMISLRLSATDNLHNVDDDRVSSTNTTLNAGLWLSLPRRDEEPLAIATHLPSAGGLQYMMDDYEATDRYEFYLKGNVSYKAFSADEDLNYVSYSLEGMARYNFPGGLKLQLVDQYIYTQDRYEIGNTNASLTHYFYSNVLIGTVDWDITEKFRIKGDVSSFFLRYDEAEFDYLERDDFFASLYGYFNWTEKTSFFLNYKYGKISYDTNSDYDSEQQLLYAGIRWDSTEKTSFYAKIGFQDKQYITDGSEFDDKFGLALEAQVKYRYSEKTLFQLTLYHKNEETDSLEAQDKNVWGATFNYDQEYTEKLQGTIRVRFEYADYTELEGEERDEWRLVFEPRIRYAFRDWINVELGYQFDTRDSTDDQYDYYSNMIFFNLNLHL